MSEDLQLMKPLEIEQLHLIYQAQALEKEISQQQVAEVAGQTRVHALRINGIASISQPFVRSVERPPSTLMICPVIQSASGESRKAPRAAISSGVPNRSSACSPATPLAICSLERMPSASGVRVRDGAIALTRTLGASSAASDRVNPSTAPFAIPIEA